MTGPGIGKIKVGGKEIVSIKGKKIEANVDIYIHVKGYSLARVTHVDVEFGNFWKFIKNGFAKIKGIKGGIFIEKEEDNNEKVYCRVFFDYANEILKENETTIAYIGVKENGFYIGFKKRIIERIEKVARKLKPELFEE